MSEAIYAMVHAARKSNPQARTVLIGHSFGALVLEKTLAQALPASFYAQEDSGGGTYKTPAAGGYDSAAKFGFRINLCQGIDGYVPTSPFHR